MVLHVIIDDELREKKENILMWFVNSSTRLKTASEDFDSEEEQCMRKKVQRNKSRACCLTVRLLK